MIVAFDVDGTLIDDDDSWRYKAVELAKGFFAAGAQIWVWSSGGYPYATTWAGRLLKEHGVPASRRLDKFDWIDRTKTDQNYTDNIDLHVDDVWSPVQLNGIIIPYPTGLTKFSPKGHDILQGPRFVST